MYKYSLLLVLLMISMGLNAQYTMFSPGIILKPLDSFASRTMTLEPIGWIVGEGYRYYIYAKHPLKQLRISGLPEDNIMSIDIEVGPGFTRLNNYADSSIIFTDTTTKPYWVEQADYWKGLAKTHETSRDWDMEHAKECLEKKDLKGAIMFINFSKESNENSKYCSMISEYYMDKIKKTTHE